MKVIGASPWPTWVTSNSQLRKLEGNELNSLLAQICSSLIGCCNYPCALWRFTYKWRFLFSKMKFSSRPASVSHSDDLGSTSTLVEVENLIDLDSDSSKNDHLLNSAKFPPSLSASLEEKHYRSHLTPSNDSGISTGSNNRHEHNQMSFLVYIYWKASGPFSLWFRFR